MSQIERNTSNKRQRKKDRHIVKTISNIPHRKRSTQRRMTNRDRESEKYIIKDIGRHIEKGIHQRKRSVPTSQKYVYT